MSQEIKQALTNISEPIKNTLDGTAISAWVVSLMGVLDPLLSTVVALLTLIWLGFRIEDMWHKRKVRSSDSEDSCDE